MQLRRSSAVRRRSRASGVLHRRWLVPVLRFTLPSACFGCGRSLSAHPHLGACPECWAGLEPLRPPLCPTCAEPLPGGTDLLGPAGGRCARCVLRSTGLARVLPAVAYDRIARRFLLRAKIGGRRELLAALGAQLATAVQEAEFGTGCDRVAAVPSHPLVWLRRGFNPAGELARALAERLGLPRLPAGRLVRRLQAARPSKRLGVAGRARALEGAFHAGGVSGRRVLLVDDVMTTGATGAACAAALRAAGARDVRLAVWARTLRGDRARSAAGPDR